MSAEHLGLIICFVMTMRYLILWARPVNLGRFTSEKVNGHSCEPLVIQLHMGRVYLLWMGSHSCSNLCMVLVCNCWHQLDLGHECTPTDSQKAKKHSISTIKINFQDASWKYAYILKINHTKESKQSKRLLYFMIPISVQSEFRPMTWALSALKLKVCQQASVRQNFLCVQRENLQAELVQVLE